MSAPLSIPCAAAGHLSPPPSRLLARLIALGAWWEPQGVAAELFGDEVPAECCVVRGAVHVAMAALDRFCVQHGAGAARFE